MERKTGALTEDPGTVFRVEENGSVTLEESATGTVIGEVSRGVQGTGASQAAVWTAWYGDGRSGKTARGYCGRARTLAEAVRLLTATRHRCQSEESGAVREVEEWLAWQTGVRDAARGGQGHLPETPRAQRVAEPRVIRRTKPPGGPAHVRFEVHVPGDDATFGASADMPADTGADEARKTFQRLTERLTRAWIDRYGE